MQTQPPSVLAVLVVRNGAAWLKRVLRSLARQAYPRLGVIAVDNGSTDGSPDILEGALGTRRVLRLPEDRGFGGAVRRALSIPAAEEADFVLLLHDDVLLGPETVTRLVEAVQRVQGAGVVGPKVRDWEDPQVLREVGFSSDRFGYPHSPLEEGEIDQGQYDAPREVLFVSSAAMLVARGAWGRAGLPDDRLAPCDGDLDFCWRVRLSGYRVLVAPSAVALHRLAGRREERPGAQPYRGRYRTERAALAGLLVNYRLITLLWVLPLYALQGLGRVGLYVLTRRLAGAADLLRAWGWNLVHLPGTFRRRVRAQSVRRVPDREIARFMSPAGARLQRWIQQGSAVLVGSRAAQVEEGEELEAPPLHRRVASVFAAHPVGVGWVVAALLTLVAFRGVLFVPHIEGGALPTFPNAAADFFREFGAGWRSTGFGGTDGASLALVPMGVGSFLALGDPQLLARLVVALGPVAAAVSCYAALRRMGASAVAAVPASACYALSALTLWASSEGRVTVVVLLVALPWITGRLVKAFAASSPERPLRWAVGTGMGLALMVSFFPAGWLPVAMVVAALTILPGPGGQRLRGLGLTLAAVVVSAALAFPFAADLAASEGSGSTVDGSVGGGFLELLRLAPGASPGSGLPALFLPVAGVLAFAAAEPPGRSAAWRSLFIAATAVPVAWLAAAGFLPAVMSNPVAYLAGAAFSLSVLVGLGLTTLVSGARRAAFGTPQMVSASLVTVLVLGLGAQALRALPGDWAVGENRLSPAWPVVSSSDPGIGFRVLWLGPADGRPFPPPGGDPDGEMALGRSNLAYGVTGRQGRSVLATGLPGEGAPFDALEATLGAVLGGRVNHGGALLAPYGLRYVVVGEGRLDEALRDRLSVQVDLDLIQRVGGLAIYRNARALPEAAVLAGQAAVDAARSGQLLAPLAIDAGEAGTLTGLAGPGWSGSMGGTEPGLLLVTDRYHPAWRLNQAGPPFPAFGWGLGFQAGPGPATVEFQGQRTRTLEVAALGALWLAALWTVWRRAGRASPRGLAAAQAPARRQEVGAGGLSRT